MAAIILTAQIGNENVQITNSTSKEKTKDKTKWLQIIYSSSLRRSLLGNRSSRSVICVMTHGLSLSSILNLIDPFDIQKESMNFLVNGFLHFHQTILSYWLKLPLINAGEQMPSEGKLILFKFLLQWRILFANFRFENLMITRMGPLLSNQWQSVIFEESISTSKFLKIFKVFPPDFVAQLYWG